MADGAQADRSAGRAAGPARWRAFLALTALERGRVDRLRDALRLDPLDGRDRALALELALGTERRLGTLDAVLRAFATRGELPRDPFVRTALRLGAAQLLFLPRIPPHAAVHGTVALLRAQQGFVNGVLRAIAGAIASRRPMAGEAVRELALPADAAGAPRTLRLPRPGLPDPAQDPIADLAVREGLPAFLVARWVATFGREIAAGLARAAALAPGVTLRVNATRADRAAVSAALATAGVETASLPDPRLLRLIGSGEASPFATRAYTDGWFSVQDPTALAAADAVVPQPGERILDLCAAPGGKATAMAEALAGHGAVFAHDASRPRLQRVAEAAARLGLTPVLQVAPDLAALPDDFDAALVDVPCSNTGVLARRVEVRRRLTPEALAAMPALQAELLRAAVRRVRPGGRVVYSTCSLEPEENRGVVDAVRRDDSRLTLRAERLTLPEQGVHDGGYFAVLDLPVGR